MKCEQTKGKNECQLNGTADAIGSLQRITDTL